MEAILTTLALVACPIGMGAAMLFMFMGTRGRGGSRDEPSIDELRAEQRRIAAEVDRQADVPDIERDVGRAPTL